MKSITIASLACIVAAAVTGLCAAWYWFRASRVQVNPTWDDEPGEVEASQNGWIAGILNNVTESSDLNRKAAFLTGMSVLLGANGGLLSVAASWIR